VYANSINWINAALALIVSLFLQIAVNYANDYSDGVRGSDTNRVGPIRLVASGLASAKSVKNASLLSVSIAAISGLFLAINISYWLVAVGAISIWAAWGYTGGKKPYGYFGFGEISVFVFFGLVATIGSYYVQTQQINWQIILLSFPIGSLSCAILSVNNLRDLPEDAKVGKRTLAVQIGEKNARKFFVFLVASSQVLAILAGFINEFAFITALCLPLTSQVVKKVSGGAVGSELILVLKKTANLQLFMAILLACAFVI
jgi:1,4-dihydroxy-2-naphthoate octaprenyltransferase